jgi:cob(I)alamin adenosyltransferase
MIERVSPAFLWVHCSLVKIYTKKGDDGTTGLFYGGRVAKDHLAPEAYGVVDELVAALGVARSLAVGGLAAELLRLQRELFVVAAEVATAPAKRHKLEPEVSLTTPAMVERLEVAIDGVMDEVGMPTEFVVPGQAPLPAALDVARTVARRAERRVVAYARSEPMEDSAVVPYLNRLADYLYMLARAAETEWQPTRSKEES